MFNAWTGGQYSIVRAFVGAAFFVHFLVMLGRGNEPWAVAAGALAAIFFAVGKLDRFAALLLWGALAWMYVRVAIDVHPSLPFMASLLLVHAVLPRAPFLSLDARGRIDPRGGWSFPPALFALAWIVAIAGYTWSGWLFAPLALFRRIRPFVWLAIVPLLLIEFRELGLAAVALHFLIFDPAWIPRRAPETTDDVFYDGTCGLCHSGMRWLIAEDSSGTSFRYAPLGGERFVDAFPDPAGLPDSVIVKTPAGTALVRSDATVHLFGRLGGLWRAGGVLFGLLPRRTRDAAYDFVAGVRYRIFGRQKEACPLLPADLRSRFGS